MIPYRPTTTPMRGAEQFALVDIFERGHWYTPHMQLRMANAIIDAGFARRIPNKVTKAQLWTYFWETVLLAYCTVAVFGVPGLGLAFGALCALTFGSLLTWVSGLIINAAIDKGVLK